MGCNEAPVAQRARDDCIRQLPGVTSSGIIGDQSHQTRRSSHNCAPMQESGGYNPYYAHAWDAHHGGDRALALKIRTAFLKDPRVRYVLDNGIGYYPSGGWFRSYDHEFHVHVSFLPGTTFDTRPFDFGGTGDDEQMLSSEAQAFIKRELANQDDRIVARVKKELNDSFGDRVVSKLNKLLSHFSLR